MWFSAKVKEAAEAEKGLTAASLSATAATAAACPCGCVRARWGGAELGARAGTGQGGVGESSGLAGARPGLSGRQGALRTHAAHCLPPGAVRGGSIGAAAEERLAPF